MGYSEVAFNARRPDKHPGVRVKAPAGVMDARR